MSRVAYGANRIWEDLQALCGKDIELKDPVPKLIKHAGVSRFTVDRYLEYLEKEGFITIEWKSASGGTKKARLYLNKNADPKKLPQNGAGYLKEYKEGGRKVKPNYSGRLAKIKEEIVALENINQENETLHNENTTLREQLKKIRSTVLALCSALSIKTQE